MMLLLQLLVNGLINAALYAMLAVGFGIVWRSLRVFHIMYGGLYVLCSYAFIILTSRFEMPMPAAIVMTMAFGFALGCMTELALYGPFHRKRASFTVVLIASLGVFVAATNAVVIGFGNELQSVSRDAATTYRLGRVVLTGLQVLQFTVGAATVTVLWLLIQKLTVFKALWAMGDQPELIPALGLPERRLRLLSLGVSTALVSVPASLITLDIGVDPHVGMSYLLVATVAVLVGGKNSFAGWVVGAGVLALLQSLVVWKLSSRWMDLTTFVVLLVMLVFRRGGLLQGWLRIEERS